MENSTGKYALIFEFNNDSPLFARVADQYINDKDFEQAITILEKGIFDYPEYPTAYYLYALALAHSGERSEALGMARKAAGIQGTTESLKYYTDLIEEISGSISEEPFALNSEHELESESADSNEIADTIKEAMTESDDNGLLELQTGITEENPEPVVEDDAVLNDDDADSAESELRINESISDVVIDEDENKTPADGAGDNVFEAEEKKLEVEDEQELKDETGVDEIVSDENEISTDDASKDILIGDDENNITAEEAGGIVIEAEDRITETENDLTNTIITNDEKGNGFGNEENDVIKPDESDIELEDELDLLAEKLNNAEMPKINDDIDLPDNVPDNDTNFQGKSLVSETLAKIHFNQGNYNQALSIYETLIDIQPEKKEYYQSMISQIKDKI